MREHPTDRAHPWAVAAVLALAAMAVTFGLVVPSARPTHADDGFVPVGSVIAGLERLRAGMLAEGPLRPASLPAESADLMSVRIERAFGRPIALPDLAPAGLGLLDARMETAAAPQHSALLRYGDRSDESNVWIGIAEDVGQFAVCDRFGQLVALKQGELVGDIGGTEQASVYAWRDDGLLWTVMGDDTALLTQVLAAARAPERSASPSR